jgi:hypothetical protein
MNQAFLKVGTSAHHPPLKFSECQLEGRFPFRNYSTVRPHKIVSETRPSMIRAPPPHLRSTEALALTILDSFVSRADDQIKEIDSCLFRVIPEPPPEASHVRFRPVRTWSARQSVGQAAQFCSVGSTLPSSQAADLDRHREQPILAGEARQSTLDALPRVTPPRPRDGAAGTPRVTQRADPDDAPSARNLDQHGEERSHA